jgi:hypothetical protein
MPKLLHETVTHILRDAPETLLRLLPAELTRQLPATAVPRVTAAELPDLQLSEYRADAVLLLGDPARPVAAIIGEVQNEFDRRKLYSLPAYWTLARAKFECPALVVILALDPEVAAAYRAPIDLGFGRGTVAPLVLSAADIPAITDVEAALACPHLAVLSAIAHGNEPGGERIAFAAIEASRVLDSEARVFYPDAVFLALNAVAQKALEQLMRTSDDPNPFHSDVARQWWAKGQSEGKVEGKAELLLKMLELKGFTVSPALQDRITACTDPGQIEAWAERFITARTLEDVFSDVD